MVQPSRSGLILLSQELFVTSLGTFSAPSSSRLSARLSLGSSPIFVPPSRMLYSEPYLDWSWRCCNRFIYCPGNRSTPPASWPCLSCDTHLDSARLDVIIPSPRLPGLVVYPMQDPFLPFCPWYCPHLSSHDLSLAPVSADHSNSFLSRNYVSS